jgi:hypothetical protein
VEQLLMTQPLWRAESIYQYGSLLTINDLKDKNRTANVFLTKKWNAKINSPHSRER